MDKNQIKMFICILLFLIVLSISYAIPVPHGTDGNIYELDGITPVGKGIDFSVYDTITGEFIQGKTKNNGYYSISLNGNNGDLIIIKTWNKYHSSNRTVILDGVMHNVDLLLNMSIPEFPPNITSIPITKAIEDKLYIYEVKAKDENNDVLKYSLLLYPDGMNIDSETGVIEWVPNNDDAGYHDVIVQVIDGIFVVNQSFTLEVINVNDAPSIISGPITSAVEDQVYEYDVEAMDVDNEVVYYYLDEKPEGMNINLMTGLIRCIPTNDDVGDNDILIRVSDGELNAIQSFTISVINTNDEFIINSTPITTAIEDELYIYDVDAYDIDGDILTYKLLSAPDGMTINLSTGLILWTPIDKQVGNNSVIVEVTDNILYQNQSFIINVLNVNDPPNITSVPITIAYVSEKYEYNVNSTDPENDISEYSLLEKPENMHINKKTGLIKWVPSKKHIGNNTVIVEVSDGDLSTNQTFNITVYPNQQANLQRGGGGGGGGVRIINSLVAEEEIEETKTTIPIKTIEKLSNIIEKISIEGKINENIRLKAQELQKRPDNIKPLDKKVYKYLEIETKDKIEEVYSIIIQFKVEKKWLEENEAEISDLILNRYMENNWEEIPTTYIDSKGDYVYYKAEIDGFSYFAISLKFIKEPTKIITTGPKEPHVISGVIFKNNRKTQVEKGTELKITNTNTGEIVEGKTGFKQNSGGYYIIINGNDGDKIDIEIKEGVYAKTTITLEGDMKNVDLILTNGGLSAITGYTIAPLIPISKEGSIIITVSLLICLGYWVYKRKKFNEKS